jgi:chromosome segregation ATPase
VREELKEQQLSIVKELLAKLKVQENFGGKQTTVLEEQLLMTMKKMLAELKGPSQDEGPSQDVLPPSDTVKGEEDDVEKEKLMAQVEDLQKQLEEKDEFIALRNKQDMKDSAIEKDLQLMKQQLMTLISSNVQTIAKQAESDGTADKEMLQKQVEHLQKKLDKKEEDLTTASQVEQTLRDTLSAERGRMEELRNETAGMKLETQDLSHQLSQSKECMKALENILNNLVLEEKMADKVVCCV